MSVGHYLFQTVAPKAVCWFLLALKLKEVSHSTPASASHGSGLRPSRGALAVIDWSKVRCPFLLEDFHDVTDAGFKRALAASFLMWLLMRATLWVHYSVIVRSSAYYKCTIRLFLRLWKGCVLNKFIPIINAYATVPIGIVDRAGLTVIFNQPLVN